MAVQTTLASLSQTASSNGPDGTVDAPSTLDDSIRYHGAFIAQLRDGSGFSYDLSSRQRLMNGNFRVNQRAVSGTVVLAAGAYGHDRWKAGAGGCTYTFAASGSDTILTISAGSLMHVVEDKNVEGGVYALANRGTAAARIAVNGAATAGAYTTATTAVPLTSATATGAQTMTVEFTTGTIDRAQLEPGTVATPFERRPYALDFALCQRYFQRMTQGAFGAGVMLGATEAVIHITFPAMRAVPAFTINYAAAGLQLLVGGGTLATAQAAASPVSSTPSSVELDFTGTAAGTLGQAALLRAANASQSIDISAEL